MGRALDIKGKRLLVGQRVKYAQAAITYKVVYITALRTPDKPGRWTLITADAHEWPIVVPSYLLEKVADAVI